MLAHLLATSFVFACGSHKDDAAAPVEAPPARTEPSSPSLPPADSSEPAVVPPPPAPGFHVLAQYTDVGHGLGVASGKIFSVDYTNDSVHVYDATSFKEVATIPVGAGPSRIEVSEPYVFVVNLMAGETGDPYVSIIDARTNKVVHELIVSEKQQGDDPDNYPTTSYPWDARVVGDRLFVTFPTNAEPDVMPIQIGSWKESTFWAAGSGPQSLAGAGDRIAVVNGRNILSGADDAILLYTSSGQLLQTFETGGRLHEAANVGSKLVFAKAPEDHAKGELLVVDPQAQSYESIPTCGGPIGVAAQGSVVYTACQWDKHIRAHDLGTKQQVFDFDLATVTPAVANPRGIAVTAKGDIVIEADNLIGILVR